jgi:hypothetical protein
MYPYFDDVPQILPLALLMTKPCCQPAGQGGAAVWSTVTTTQADCC